jgi:O-methyltransferase
MNNLKRFESKHNPEIDEKFHQLNLHNIANTIYWLKFFESVVNVPGDIVECGVGRGRSLLILTAINYILSKEEGGQRTVFGYDSFEGFPAPSKQDATTRNPQKGEWSKSPSGKYTYSPEFIQQVLNVADIPLDKMRVIIKKGFFSDSLKSHPDRPIALLHIDGDLYQSCLDALVYLYPKVSKGGIVIFDEYRSGDRTDFPGERLAIKDYFMGNTPHLKVSVWGNHYLIKQ